MKSSGPSAATQEVSGAFGSLRNDAIAALTVRRAPSMCIEIFLPLPDAPRRDFRLVSDIEAPFT